MKDPATMKDIAKVLGVSIVTVSKALSGKDGVGEELRKKILNEAERIGYRKNTNASDMSQGKNHNIGIVIREHSIREHRVSSTLLHGLIKNLSDLGYYGIEEIVTKEQEETGQLPNIARENKVEGIILAGFLRPAYVTKIQRTGIPILAVDFSSVTSDDDSVICDNVYGSYLLTRHLVKLNHERIVFVGNPLYDDNTMDRYLGYVKALREQGLGDQPPVYDIDELGNDKEITLVPGATAYVTATSRTGFNLVRKIQSTGDSIPKDISVVCFDDDVFAEMANPSITAFHVDYNEMAYLAAVTMVQKINEKKHIGRKTISGTLVARQSSGRPKANMISQISEMG